MPITLLPAPPPGFKKLSTSLIMIHCVQNSLKKVIILLQAPARQYLRAVCSVCPVPDFRLLFINSFGHMRSFGRCILTGRPSAHSHLSTWGSFFYYVDKFCPLMTAYHGLRTPREELAFTARPKIQSQSKIFRYSQSIFYLPHWPILSDIFDLCHHWVSVLRDQYGLMEQLQKVP